jgi:hypothetical protein
MPSYNQIGFDSLSFILRMLETRGNQALAVMIPAQPSSDGDLRPDAASGRGFPLHFIKDQGSWVLKNTSGFQATALNFTLPFEEFRLSLSQGDIAQAYASARCSEVPTYGYFLRNLGFCSPKADRISILGATNLKSLPPLADKQGPGLKVESRKLSWGRIRLEVRFDEPINSEEVISLVLYKKETLEPIPYDPKNLSRTLAPDGSLSALALETLEPKDGPIGFKLLVGEQIVSSGGF